MFWNDGQTKANIPKKCPYTFQSNTEHCFQMLYSMSKLNIYITPQIKIVVVAKLQEESQSPLPPGYSFLCRPFPI